MTAASFYPFTLPLLLVASAWAAPPSAEENLAQYAKGIFAELDDDKKGARKHFEATLKNDAASFTVARKTAHFQLADQDLPSAAKTLRNFAHSQPEHLSSHLYYADFLERNAPRDAIAQKAASDLLTGANERHPNRYEVYSRLISLHENLGEREKSLAVFNAQFEAVEAGPEHWMSLAPIAKTLLPKEDPELKKKLDLIADKTVETGVAIAAAARRASDYYRQTGRMDDALAVLKQHVEIQPDSLDLRTRLGLLQFYNKEEESALKTLLETLEIDPDQMLAHKALSQYYARNEQPEKSLQHRAEVLRIAGGSPDDFLELANQYLELKKPHPARLILEKARFDHPENPALAARLAIATLRDGDTTTAARLFRQAEALAKESSDPSAKNVLDADFQLEFAGSLKKAGDVAAAENRLRNAIRGIPPGQPKKSARALRELARLWIDQKKNLAPAASLLKRAKSLEPGNPETQALLDRARSQ